MQVQTGQASAGQFMAGFDIGASKIAAALYDRSGNEISGRVMATPRDYAALLKACLHSLHQLETTAGGKAASIGIGVPGTVDRDAGIVTFAANTPCLVGQALRDDMAKATGRNVRIANDADCAALSEAIDGAGKGYRNVFGLILGSGVGGGLVINGKLVEGANGLTGEFGHLPLPCREPADGPSVACDCGQTGCIDKSASGRALARLYHAVSGQQIEAEALPALAQSGDHHAQATMNAFYNVVAKATVPILHMFDPDVIVVSGGLSQLPRLYDEVPLRWGKYALRKNLKTRFVAARHGSMSGLRGAAWRGQES